MNYGDAIVVDHLRSADLQPTRSVVHDAEFGVRLLYKDPRSGAEHYLVRYPAGLGARAHRHTAAHTIVVLDGRLAVNGEVIGPGAYCHFPAGEAMVHGPADGDACLFVTIFDGPYDIEALDR
jgi:quercetin dioxygenase-like cupin family protein